jgi:Ser/Thr protein kinase RdoA (MazF antagonist)
VLIRIAGYRSTLKLNEQEQSLIPLLVKVRLVTSVIVSANSKLSKPDDEYIVVSHTSDYFFLLMTDWSDK